jgi:two-component system nitrogen regulation sensor histidine kinase NtrY
MASNRFASSIVLQVVVLIITIFLFCYLLIEFRDRHIFFILLVLLSVAVIQIINLIYYVSRTNRELSRFLMVLRNSDYTIKFSDHKMEQSFKELAEIMDKTVESLRELRFEKEVQVHLLKMITAEIKTGIITVNNEGKIVLMNYKAQKLLGSAGVQTWGQLKAVCPSFVKEVESMGSEGNKFTEILVGKEIRKISLNLSIIPLMEKKIKVITIEDIQTQVEWKESDAWLKLTRILMHEIMNSVTPLTSLTETIGHILKNKIMEEKQLTDITEEDINDIRFCLENIQMRKKHLQSFIENYHRLSHLPHPDKQAICAYDVVNSVVCCMQTDLDNSHIELQIDPVLCDMVIWADASQIEQVLINLIKNSMQALQKSPKKLIHIKGLEKDQHFVIEISDTGEGIPPERLEDIFIPFYTTKESGSGIGLGLSRQIMLAHHGYIRVQSELGIGSSFSLWFEKPDN